MAVELWAPCLTTMAFSWSCPASDAVGSTGGPWVFPLVGLPQWTPGKLRPWDPGPPKEALMPKGAIGDDGKC